MPIRKENLARYPKDWKRISKSVRDAAGNRCEGSPAFPECRAENGKPHPETGSRVVLTVAHLDHKPENCARDNLRAWCQRCHNVYDAPMRRRGIRERARSALVIAPLLGVALLASGAEGRANPDITLAAAAMLWSHPGLAPCATPAGNPCWLGPMPTIPSEICDGDVITNTGSRDGRMIGPWTQLVALDVEHMSANGLRFRTREDGATCIPTLTDGEAHLVEACGNRATIIRRDSVTGAALRPSEYMRAGISSPGLTRTWGGASAHVASPHFPPVYVGDPGRPHEPPETPHTPHTPAVPLPAPLWLLLGALAGLGAMSLGRRA